MKRFHLALGVVALAVATGATATPTSYALTTSGNANIASNFTGSVAWTSNSASAYCTVASGGGPYACGSAGAAGTTSAQIGTNYGNTLTMASLGLRPGDSVDLAVV